MGATNPKYSPQFLKGILKYDAETGEFFTNSGRKLRVGLDAKKYGRVRVRGVGYLKAHRVAWSLATGNMPPDHIDHIDGDKLNNKFSNLRACTPAENQRNRGRFKSNKSGFKGVSWMKRPAKWQAQICVDRKVKHLGLFENKVDAARAYDIAAIELHGAFAKTNFPVERYLYVQHPASAGN